MPNWNLLDYNAYVIAIRLLPWDAAEHLETEEDMAAYLDAALVDGDPNLIVAVLGDIARARGMPLNEVERKGQYYEP